MMMRAVCGVLCVSATLAGAQVQTQGWITTDETWTGQVQVVGDVMVTNNVTLTIAAGAEITFLSNSLAVYVPGTDSGGRLLLLGEAAHRIKVTSIGGLATNGTIGRYPNLYGRELRAEYVDFSNLGYHRADGRGYAVYSAPNAGDTCTVRFCTFSNCYDAAALAYHGSAFIDISDNDFRYSATNTSAQVHGVVSASPANRTVTRNTMDAGLTLGSSALVYSNVLVGSNAFLSLLSSANGSVIAHNYVHVPRNAGGALGVAATNVLVRDNYLSGGRESLQVTALQDCQVRDNVLQASGGQTRHVSGLAGESIFSGNILFGAQPANESILLGSVRTNVTLKNNVVAGAGAIGLNLTTGGVSEVRVRNNVFWNCGAATRPVITFSLGLTNALGATDHNCFYSTNAAIITNYSTRVTVTGKTMRVDAGFGYHDLTEGGPLNEQVDPLLAGPLTGITVATHADMLARTHTVDEVLAEARAAFALQAGSPCRDAGDPADDGDADVSDGQRDIGLEYAGGSGMVDVDGDDLEDNWELLHFGSLTNGAQGDVDQDGQPNVDEFVAQTEPTNAGSRFACWAITNSTARFVVVPTVTGRLYRLWSAAELAPTQAWGQVAGPLAGSGGFLSLSDGSTPTVGLYRLTVEMDAP